MGKAFLPEEGGAASAVTEGAARKQICFRVNLMRILFIRQNSLSLRLRRIQLPQRGSQKPSLSLRDISPEGRDKFSWCVRDSLQLSYPQLWITLWTTLDRFTKKP